MKLDQKTVTFNYWRRKVSKQKAKVSIYTKEYCPYCQNAKTFFNSHDIKYDEIKLEENPEAIEKIKKESGWRTFPIIVINNQLIGGYTDMKQLSEQGKLEDLLLKSN